MDIEASPKAFLGLEAEDAVSYEAAKAVTVSYTHLTLPTKRIV